jgi:DNA-binding LacI/PurR family transcriptional regulator
VQLALDRLEHRNAPPRRVVLKTDLKIRESVAPPARAQKMRGTA